MNEPRVELRDERSILLEAVAVAAEGLGIPWLLTGASSRVLLLEKLLGLPPGKATEDLDFGVMVRTWNEYQALKDSICEEGRFQPDPRQSQRIWYGEDFKLDLIPFGAVAEPGETIRWPAEEGVVLSVLGFLEAYDSAVDVLVNGKIHVRVPTAAGMLLLKLIAWEDRHIRVPGRDASDIAYILRHAGRIVGQDALYGQYASATEAADWDLDLAAARVLGVQVAAMARARTRSHLGKMLAREVADGEDSTLVREASSGLPPGRQRTTHSLLLLRQFNEGFATGFLKGIPS